MTFYESKKNVDDYIKMADGYDGGELIAILKQHLPERSTLLELGMGPGTDLDLLAQSFMVTGSDSSSTFLDAYREKNPSANLLKLDAATLETEQTFDCIYSNKVLHHLSKIELERSFLRQRKILNKNGILMHSFWAGNKEEEMHGLRFVYYTEDILLKLIGPGFDILAVGHYEEFEDNDSFYLLLRLQDAK